MEGLKLRAVEPDDIDFLYRIENLPEVWSVTWGDAPVSRQLLWEYINAYSADIYADRQLRLIVEAEGRAVGTVELTDFSPRCARAMVGVAILPEYRRQGYATAAVKAIIERARETLALHQLAVMIPRDNEASLRLFESLGFRTSGCLRSWHRRGRTLVDVIVMQLMLDAVH